MGMAVFCAWFQIETIGKQGRAARKLPQQGETWLKNVILKEFSIYG